MTRIGNLKYSWHVNDGFMQNFTRVSEEIAGYGFTPWKTGHEMCWISNSSAGVVYQRRRHRLRLKYWRHSPNFTKMKKLENWPWPVICDPQSSLRHSPLWFQISQHSMKCKTCHFKRQWLFCLPQIWYWSTVAPAVSLTLRTGEDIIPLKNGPWEISWMSESSITQS